MDSQSKGQSDKQTDRHGQGLQQNKTNVKQYTAISKRLSKSIVDTGTERRFGYSHNE